MGQLTPQVGLPTVLVAQRSAQGIDIAVLVPVQQQIGSVPTVSADQGGEAVGEGDDPSGAVSFRSRGALEVMPGQREPVGRGILPGIQVGLRQLGDVHGHCRKAPRIIVGVNSQARLFTTTAQLAQGHHVDPCPDLVLRVGGA